MGWLYDFTFAINFLGLTLTMWLGIYLVSSSIRYGMAWLSALTLWSLGGLFLDFLLTLIPPQPISWPGWLRAVFMFWPGCAMQGQANCWLEGWLFVPALALWHHVTVLMLPGRLTAWRWLRILAIYAAVISPIVIQGISPILYSIPGADPLYLNSLKAGPLYPFFMGGLLVIILLCVVNLGQAASARPAALPRKRLALLILATLIAGLIVPLSIAGSAFHEPVPSVTISLTLAIPIGLFGYGVVSYSTSMEGRTLRRDFFYHLAMLCIVILAYVLAAWLLIRLYQATTSLLVFLPIMAIITHALINPAYRLMDRLFFRTNARQVRSSLRQLMNLAGESKPFEENLAEALHKVCTSVNASYGVIFLFENGSVRRVAACHFNANLSELRQADLQSDDVTGLESGQLGSQLPDAALLFPLYAADSQVGALVLGCPENGEQYAPREIEDLLHLSDMISDVVYVNQLKSSTIRQMVEQARAQRRPSPAASGPVPLEEVELALRNLHNYSFLADSPLAGLKLVQSRLAQSEVTHLERGKIVHEVLLDALEKLCPPSHDPRRPNDPPPREWHSYLILRSAYRDATPNRDIMAQLYISEGTFNRTRRAAIRAMTRALAEMEAANA